MVSKPSSGLEPGVRVTQTEVVFTAAAHNDLVPASVWLDARDFGSPLTFQRSADGTNLWHLCLPIPPVQRLEYLIAWRAADGSEVRTPDPANPLKVGGAFGDHSVVLFDGYCQPTWLDFDLTAHLPGSDPESPPPAGGTPEPIHYVDNSSGITVTGALWTPVGFGADDPLPLLVVHDGREFEQFGRITTYLRALAHRRQELTVRALLLDPVDRDRCYSANPDYAQALTTQVIPAVHSRCNVRGRAIGLGASLGAVAMLHAAALSPDLFAGALLQSGSFFTDRFDRHESRFGFYDRVTRFTSDAVAATARWQHMVLHMTCGIGEENLENNREFAERLMAAGVAANLDVTADAHNFVSWRDAWEPNLELTLAGTHPDKQGQHN